MATSGSADFDRTRNELIEAAYRKAGVLGEGQSASAVQIKQGSEALNVITKSLQSEGIRLWSIDWVTTTLSSSSVVIGTDSKVYTANRSHFPTLDDRPITGKNNISFWEQTGSGGSTWTTAATYNSIGDFLLPADTLWIEEAFIRDKKVDSELTIISFSRYFKETNKFTKGTRPSTLAVDYGLVSRAYFDPKPIDTKIVLHSRQVKKLQDYDAATDNPDLWARWQRGIIYDLASYLSDDHPSIPIADRQFLTQKAEGFKGRAKNSEIEAKSTQFIRPYLS